MDTLHGKVILVTGGGTGIGMGISLDLASRGARVGIIQITQEEATRAASMVPEAVGFAADISDRTQVEKMISQAVTKFGQIDGLVNNAGVSGMSVRGRFDLISDQIVDRIIDTNLKGAIWCSQAVSRHFVEQKIPGCIVHISSVGAFAAQEAASIYCATKAALVSLAQGMALDLAPHGIRVNAVAPGDIQTDTSDDVFRGDGSSKYRRVTPAGRRGTPKDVANAVAFLLSSEAAFITGTTVAVDGGFVCY